ncbi:MAG: polyribonucleotide nucleotidyltransferase, partial [Chloroflexi bacterium]|nr:polyribonucleotide nucleotidyltransferase [Chloroflexota bacterium]
MSELSDLSKSCRIDIAERTLTIETGKLAGQAGGAVTVRYGDTVVLVTACVGGEEKAEERDFLPLTVDFEERLYAAGKIPGSFFRREGRPGQEATLAMRLTDRALRPLFPKGFHREVQIVATVFSADQENDPDILLIIGASAALGLSEIPFSGPVSAVRIGYVNDEYVINPTFSQLSDSKLDLVVAGTQDAVIMIEAGASQVPEKVILEATRIGHDVNAEICTTIERFTQANGKPKLTFQPPDPKTDLLEKTGAAARSV